ncbi:MAG: glutathione S-transferase [Alphaproteobacteria bacterium]|nr:MAG: glutathione S-transferase [Alphaproteobacteria bacterium]
MGEAGEDGRGAAALPRPVRLYDAARAPNPRRVRIFLAEKGITLPVRELAIMQGEHFAPEHMAKIGTHHVPALELADGTILTESVAICRYLEALTPEPPLMGRDPLEAAVIEMWQRRVEFQLFMPIGFVLRHGNPAMQVLERVQCPEWAEANRPRVLEGLNWLDRRLQTSPFIAGDEFSIADITGIVAIDFMRVIRQKIPEECSALAEWAERIHARPGCVA